MKLNSPIEKGLDYCSNSIKKYLPYLFLIVCVWIAHFLFSNDFGFYEDDWRFSGTAITNTLPQNWNRLRYAISTFWQGRPLHMAFLTLIPFVAGKLGGIKGIYWVGFAILSANACLWYSLVKKMTQQPYIALISGLFFCLYPADTTFKFIQHLLGIQTALLFILIAFHLYWVPSPLKQSVNYYRWGSYGFAVLSLLDYESVFLVFLTAPLLRPTQSTRWQTFRHGLILFIILGGYLGLRKLAGESRMQTVSSLSLLQNVLYQVTVGPVIAFFSFIQRPWAIATHLQASNGWVLGVSVVLLSIILLGFLGRYPLAADRGNGRQFLTWLILGGGMAILAYPSALLLSVHTLDGRASRVHFSASVGISLIWALMWGMLILMLHHRCFWQYLAVLCLSVQLSLLLLFSIAVQEKYVESWQYQRSFWRDVVTLAPDMTDKTVILVQSPSLAWGKQINPFDWSVPDVLSSIYDFPEDWQFPPRLYRLNSSLANPEQWQATVIKDQHFFLTSENDGVIFYYPWEAPRWVDPVDVILLVEQEGRLVRQDQLNLVTGGTIPLRSAPPRSPQGNLMPQWQQSPIFRELLPPKGCRGCDAVPRLYVQSQH